MKKLLLVMCAVIFTLNAFAADVIFRTTQRVSYSNGVVKTEMVFYSNGTVATYNNNYKIDGTSRYSIQDENRKIVITSQDGTRSQYSCVISGGQLQSLSDGNATFSRSR